MARTASVLHHVSVNGPAITFAVGFVVELVGLGVAAHGFHETWKQHSRGEQFFAPLFAAGRRRLADLRRGARRLLRRHETVAADAHASSAMGLSSHARAVVGYGPLPSITGDPAGFADLVDKRLAELMQRVQAVDHRLSDQLAAMRERDLRGLRDRLAHVEETTRGVAIGGLREQVFGWALVVLGFTIQGIAQFIQPS